MTAITVNFNSVLEISEEQFYQLCVHNPEIKFERNVAGEIIVMSRRANAQIVVLTTTGDAIASRGGETGRRNAKLIARFIIWNEQAKLGEVFDSSTGYRLPNGANRSPDVSWIERQRWDSLTSEQKEKFIPLAPDFVLELLSPTDYLANTQAKMKEYINSGVRLGWLINPRAKQVEIYRLGQDVKLLDSPQSISDDEILPGFTLDLTNIF